MLYKVTLPLGLVEVRLERQGLGLSERGGFEVKWASGCGDALSEETYRTLIKTHLREVYVMQEQAEPSSITLNLASHQLLDDLKGWTKLNYHTKPSGD